MKIKNGIKHTIQMILLLTMCCTFSDQFLTVADKGYFLLEQEDIDEFKDVLNRADKFILFHSVPREIIMEEAQSYFSGDKSVHEAVSIIQSRVSLYLSEQQ